MIQQKKPNNKAKPVKKQARDFRTEDDEPKPTGHGSKIKAVK